VGDACLQCCDKGGVWKVPLFCPTLRIEAPDPGAMSVRPAGGRLVCRHRCLTRRGRGEGVLIRRSFRHYYSRLIVPLPGVARPSIS
jgi:hypothetical protein